MAAPQVTNGLISLLTNLVPNMDKVVQNTINSLYADNNNSIIDVAKVARVEPITLVSSDLTSTKELYDILQGVLNIYAAYYMQAVSILSTQLIDARILKILDKLNPDRDLKSWLATQASFSLENLATVSLENAKYKLPFIESDKNNIKVALESSIDVSSGSAKIEKIDKLPFAVGKIIEVKLDVALNNGKDRAQVTIPVVVKLDTMVMDSEVLDMIITYRDTEVKFSSRLKDALAGRISFIKDFILCSDLIKNKKKAMIKDKTGYYTKIISRINSSKLYSLLTGNVSLNKISSVIVLSEENEKYIQRKLGGQLVNELTRKLVFENTEAMLIVLVDREWERVSIFARDIDGFSQHSFDEFKTMGNANNASMITDTVKSLALGNPPSF